VLVHKLGQVVNAAVNYYPKIVLVVVLSDVFPTKVRIFFVIALALSMGVSLLMMDVLVNLMVIFPSMRGLVRD
jgi:hypothetical protein